MYRSRVRTPKARSSFWLSMTPSVNLRVDPSEFEGVCPRTLRTCTRVNKRQSRTERFDRVLVCPEDKKSRVLLKYLNFRFVHLLPRGLNSLMSEPVDVLGKTSIYLLSSSNKHRSRDTWFIPVGLTGSTPLPHRCEHYITLKEVTAHWIRYLRFILSSTSSPFFTPFERQLNM